MFGQVLKYFGGFQKVKVTLVVLNCQVWAHHLTDRLALGMVLSLQFPASLEKQFYLRG